MSTSMLLFKKKERRKEEVRISASAKGARKKKGIQLEGSKVGKKASARGLLYGCDAFSID